MGWGAGELLRPGKDVVPCLLDVADVGLVLCAEVAELLLHGGKLLLLSRGKGWR